MCVHAAARSTPTGPPVAEPSRRESVGATKRNRTPSFLIDTATSLGTAAAGADVKARRSIGGAGDVRVPAGAVAVSVTPHGTTLALQPTPGGQHMKWSEDKSTEPAPQRAGTRCHCCMHYTYCVCACRCESVISRFVVSHVVFSVFVVLGIATRPRRAAAPPSFTFDEDDDDDDGASGSDVSGLDVSMTRCAC